MCQLPFLGLPLDRIEVSNQKFDTNLLTQSYSP